MASSDEDAAHKGPLQEVALAAATPTTSLVPREIYALEEAQHLQWRNIVNRLAEEDNRRWPYHMSLGRREGGQALFADFMDAAVRDMYDHPGIARDNYDNQLHTRFGELVVDQLHAVGRISDADYQSRRGELVGAAARALKEGSAHLLPGRAPTEAEAEIAQRQRAEQSQLECAGNVDSGAQMNLRKRWLEEGHKSGNPLAV